MSSHRHRANSPTRYYGDQPRSSTGTLYVTPFETTSRVGPSSQSRSSVSTIPSGRQNVAYEAQPMRKSTIADGKTKTEYAVRPRNNSFAPSDSKRPLSVSTRAISPSRRNSSIVVSPRELTPASGRGDSSRLLLPSTPTAHHGGHHQRHNSTSMADLGSRESTRDRREKSYYSKPPYVQKISNSERPPARSNDEEQRSRPPARPNDEEQWSYTGPREQFDRDYPQRPTDRKEATGRRERPISYYGTDRPAGRRDAGPPAPPVNKPVARVERGEQDRLDSRPSYDSDPDQRSERPRKRHSTRQPVVHQQQFRGDDGYSSARDDYESKAVPKSRNGRYDNDDVRPRERYRDDVREDERNRDYERRYHREPDREQRQRDYERDNRPYEGRRKQRSRENSPERSSLKSLAAGAFSTLAAAGVVKGLDRDYKDKGNEGSDDEQRERRHRKSKHRSRRDDPHDESDTADDRRREDRHRHRPEDDPESDRPDEDTRRRRSSRKQHREDSDESDGKLAPDETRHDRNSSRTRVRDEEKSPDADRQGRELVPAHKHEDNSESLERRTISPGENEDDRPRRVQLVEPVKDKEEIKPRGILKPARQVPFPEDPHPIREGVAPLKDATKDGIPVNARWTKINRLLVNPEALEKAHERFEEREDYVIVLRVLSREEISKLADKTKEIRETREREWQRKIDEERRSKNVRTNEDLGSGDDDYYAEDRDHDRPLAIEAPPAPAVDFYNLQNQPNYQVPVKSMPGGPPVSDGNFESSYSQNV